MTKQLALKLTDDQYRIAKALALLRGYEFDTYATSLFVDMLSIEIERHFDGQLLSEMYKAIGRTDRA
jgi:hypothetical protein